MVDLLGEQRPKLHIASLVAASLPQPLLYFVAFLCQHFVILSTDPKEPGSPQPSYDLQSEQHNESIETYLPESREVEVPEDCNHRMHLENQEEVQCRTNERAVSHVAEVVADPRICVCQKKRKTKLGKCHDPVDRDLVSKLFSIGGSSLPEYHPAPSQANRPSHCSCKKLLRHTRTHFVFPPL